MRKREETNSETEEERARCSIGNNLRDPSSPRQRARKRKETKSKIEKRPARCSICYNLEHSITLLPNSII